MTAAETIVRALGGPTKAAKAVGVSRVQVHRWMRAGRIPHKHVSTVVRLAAEQGIALQLADFYPEAADHAA